VKILYGVCGDGMGHAVRSAVVGRHLQAQGHAVTFVSYSGALSYLAERWPKQTISIVGLSAVIVNNQVSPVATLFSNLRRQWRSLPEHLLSFACAALGSAPDVVISDFDPWSAHYAWLMRRPIVAVDNIHFMTRCAHPPSIYQRGPGDLAAANMFYPLADSLVANAGRYLVTSFVDVPVSRPRTTLHLPILREEILRARGGQVGSHVVTYFNSKADHAAICRALTEVGVPIRAYGDPTRKVLAQEGKVTFCPFAEAEFIRDVASARAVVGGAGFTFMTEAIYLGKPMLAVPYGAQFEQMLNANYLGALGYGERCDRLTADDLSGFLGRIPGYERELRGLVHDGNRDLLQSVDRAIGEAA
jgi:uncharacterized protein (TIGR00661 family)